MRKPLTECSNAFRNLASALQAASSKAKPINLTLLLWQSVGVLPST